MAQEANGSSLEVVHNDTSVAVTNASGKIGADKNHCNLTQTMSTADGLVHRILREMDGNPSKMGPFPPNDSY